MHFIEKLMTHVQCQKALFGETSLLQLTWRRITLTLRRSRFMSRLA